MMPFLLLTLLQAPLPRLTLESCRGPEYTAAEFSSMAGVVEIPEGRERFPGSYLFVPATPGPHPGILTLHGSGGGRAAPGIMCGARLLAAAGYAVLAFCYFDCGSDAIPEALSEVDLGRTYEAMVWLKRSPYVGGGKVLLSGISRGAEQAVLLAALLGRAARSDSSLVLPDAVQATSPYGRVVGAFDRKARAEGNRRGRMFDGRAWKWTLEPAGVKPGSDIRLQDYPGPVLVVHGAVDPVWPLADGADYLRRTLTRAGLASHREEVAPGAARAASWPVLPEDRVLFYVFEGEPHLFSWRGAVARRRLVLAFLERSLR